MVKVKSLILYTSLALLIIFSVASAIPLQTFAAVNSSVTQDDPVPSVCKLGADGNAKTVGGVVVYKRGLLEGVPCDKPITSKGAVLKIFENVMKNILLPISGTLFTIMVILGGLMYITSAGNEQRAEMGKKALTAAIIGLIITSLAYVIVTTFVTILGGGIS